MDDVVALAAVALVFLAVGLWSRRYYRRIRGTSEMMTSHGVKYGVLHWIALPLSGICGLGALFRALVWLVDGR